MEQLSEFKAVKTKLEELLSKINIKFEEFKKENLYRILIKKRKKKYLMKLIYY